MKTHKGVELQLYSLLTFRGRCIYSHKGTAINFRIIKEITGHKHQKNDVQDIKTEHKLVTDPKEIASIFNNYFTFKNIKGNKGETESRQQTTTSKHYYPNLNGNQHVSALVLKTFSAKEISTIIKSIKSKNS